MRWGRIGLGRAGLRISLVRRRHFQFAIFYANSLDAFLKVVCVIDVLKYINNVARLDFSWRYPHGSHILPCESDMLIKSLACVLLPASVLPQFVRTPAMPGWRYR
jgi:hypothetical protein